jgi:hypothetical protein
MNKLLFLSAFALFSCIGLSAQTSATAPADLLYFEFASIDFNQYSKLHESVKSDGNFAIETVCIPAKVICIKKVNSNTNTNAFEQLALKAGLTAILWIQDNPVHAFEERCLSARTRN